jgi:hypothetical protein
MVTTFYFLEIILNIKLKTNDYLIPLLMTALSKRPYDMERKILNKVGLITNLFW